MYRIILTRKAAKVIEELPNRERRRLSKAIDQLRENPLAGKQLQGTLAGLRSLRVWPYRIIYAADRDTVTVTVLRVGHRQSVYK